MPLRDERTPVQVAVLLRLLPDQCLTKKVHEQNAVVTVPTIDNSQIYRPATDLTATDLLRVYVYEVTELGRSKITALAVRNQLYLLPGESWIPAAHRILMHTKTNVQYYKPHAMKETYYWRTVAGDQLEDHYERIIRVLIPSDKNPFHPVFFNLRSAIRDDLNRRPLNEGQLLLGNMVDRGITAHTMYGNFLKQISHLSHLYPPPLTEDSQPRHPSRPPVRSPRQRFSTVASYRRSRRPISPIRDIFGAQSAVASPTAAAAHPHPSSKVKSKRSFDDRVLSAIVSAIRSEFSDDDSQDSSPETPNDSTQRRPPQRL